MGTYVCLTIGRGKLAGCDLGIRWAGGRFAGFDFTIVADVAINTFTFVISKEICTNAAVQAWVRIAFVYFFVTEFTFPTGIALADTSHASSILTTINSVTGTRPRFLPDEKHT